MILGIYHPAQGVGHDTGVALIQEDGTILGAQSEERFSRIKMDGGFPFRAFENLRKTFCFTASDLSSIAIPFMSATNKTAEGSHLLLSALKDPALGFQQIRNRLEQDQFQKGMEQIGAYQYLPKYVSRIREVWKQDGHPLLSNWREFLQYCSLDSVPLVQMDHHIAHAAGAYFTSGQDEALLITCDGVGALKSGIVATAQNGRIRVIARTFYPHSPGEFWEVITAICGFHHMKHGGKITGLAAYGDPEAACYEVMKGALGLNDLTIRSNIHPAQMAHQLRNFKREDIAATAQRRLEEVITELIRRAIEKTNIARVVLSGGVFANVKLNQRISQLERLEEIYVYPAMGDEGLALGAALFAAGKNNSLKTFRFSNLYLGPEYTDSEIENELVRSGLKFQRYSDPELARKAADLLTQGKLVAVFRGRMEFGPRALGHRSILYQTTDPTVNDWLNKRLKRTEFMPFAPVTLQSEANKCYGNLSRCSYTAQFMTITADCLSRTKEISPAVVHLDGTARPQLINKDSEPFYNEILRNYYERTGIPSLINTSFNMHEEPIVCNPSDAIQAFQLGHLDNLVVGPFLVCVNGC
jgi:carbamoyltransferase